MLRRKCASNPTARPRRSTVALHLEALENRTTPALFLVNSPLDVGDANPGDGLAETASGVTTLRAAIQEANAWGGADVIQFGLSPSVKEILLVNGELPVTDDLTITGPGASKLSIDAHGNSRILLIEEGVTTSVSGLTLTGGGNVDAGGGIRLLGTELTLTNVVVSGNTSNFEGGGIDAVTGLVRILDSTISDNSSQYGGGIDIFQDTGVLIPPSLEVIDSLFLGNSASSDGGAIYNDGELTITGSRFEGSSAFADGGVLYNDSPAMTAIIDSTLSTNSAFEGGAVFNTFGSAVTISGGVLSNNSAERNGGGVYNLGDLSVTDASFSGNTATEDGGAVYNRGEMSATGTTLSRNGATSGGGVYNEGGTLTVDDSTFSDNKADAFGGGIRTLGGILSVGEGEFMNNTAVVGGGIDIQGFATATIDGSTFHNNSSTSVGGAVHIFRSTVEMTDVNVTDNNARYGGGIANSGTLTISGARVTGNSAEVNGGGLWNRGTLNLSDTLVSGNSAGSDGGAFNFVSGSSFHGVLNVTGATFLGNAAQYGGGISNAGGSLTVTDTQFVENTVSEWGGGIANFDGGTVHVSLSHFTDNTAADWGGGIYQEDNSSTVIVDSTLSGNSAGDTGGGIGNFRGTIQITGSTLSNNSSLHVGGAIANDAGGILLLTNSTLSGNSAQEGGGVWNKGHVTITHGTVAFNSAMEGGGIHGHPNMGSLTLRNTIVARNKGNASPDISGTIWSLGVNLIGNTGGVTGYRVGIDILNVDPMLAALADNGGPTRTHALLAGSTAIDAADPFFATPTDQRGYLRPTDGDGDGSALPDIGAFEFTLQV